MIGMFLSFLRLSCTKARICRQYPTTKIEPGVVIKGNLANLKLGKHVQFLSGVVLHLGGMKWCKNAGYIEFGDHSLISPNTVIYGCGPGGIRIGMRFDCGPGVGIFSSRADYVSDRVTTYDEIILQTKNLKKYSWNESLRETYIKKGYLDS